jgi:hypothetical protein
MIGKIAALLLLGQSLGGLPVPEPSIVPSLLNPGNVKKLAPMPGGSWAYERPRDVVDIGRDERSKTLSLGLPVGRSFCELRLTTLVMPTGHAGSLAMAASIKLKALPQAQFQPAQRIGARVLRHGVRYNHLNNPAMARFVLQWFQVDTGMAVVAHLEAPANFEAACAGRAQQIVLSMRRVGK